MASLVAQRVKHLPAMRETGIQSLGWEAPLEKERLPTQVFWPGEFHVLNSPWGLKELDTTERLSLSLSFHFILLCLLRNATPVIHVSFIVLTFHLGMLDMTERFHFHALEKQMATHSSVLAWRIPGMGEPGGLPSMGSHKVRHD